MLRDQLQEAQRLSDALRMEREIYVNINQVGNAPQRLVLFLRYVEYTKK